MKNLSATSNRSAQSKPTKVNAPSTPRRKLYLAIAAQLLALSTPAWAGPEGGVVVGGSGTIKQSDLNTTITQNTDRLAIDWNSFNVDANERVTFIQPTQNSVALNRILGGDTSRILGQINANGHVVLMNPNGILFGKDSTINVGGLVASGLSMDPNQFMNGDFALKAVEGTDGAVVNAGIINAATGGNVVLVGQHVDNQGFISAKLGSITLAAGKESILSFDNNGLIGVRVIEATLHDQIGVQNSGRVQAEGGQVLLTSSVSQDIFTKAVNAGDLSTKSSVVMHGDGSFTLGGGADVVNTGAIDVSSDKSVAGRVVVLGQNVTNEGSILADSLNPTSNSNAGSVELHAVDTTLVAGAGRVSANTSKSGTGGDVKILGDKVGLLDQATVSATGVNGGGSILVGGDQEGKNALVRNAEFVHVDKDASVDASATDKGDGGTVIAFAEDSARIYGGLSARGGNDGGDGGFIETSGKVGFIFDSIPDTSAVNGSAGTWLIDPYNISIGAPFANDGFDLLDGVFTSIAINGPSQGGHNISVSTIESAFDTNSNVVIRTGTGGTDLGQISISYSPLSLSAGSDKTLTLDAIADIVIDNDILLQGANLVLSSGSIVKIGDGIKINTNGGDIDITASNGMVADKALFDTTGGVNSGNVTIKGQGDFQLPGMSIKGDISVNSQRFGIALPSANISAGGNLSFEASAGDIFGSSNLYKLTAGQDISLTASQMVIVDLDIDAVRDITISDGSSNTPLILNTNITSGRNTKITTASSDIVYESGLLTAGTSLELNSGGAINLNSGITLDNADLVVNAAGNISAVNINTQGGDIFLKTQDQMYMDADLVTQGGQINIDTASGFGTQFSYFDTRGGSVSGSGNVTIHSTQGPAYSPDMDIDGNLTVTADSGNIYTLGGNTTATGNVTFSAPSGTVQTLFSVMTPVFDVAGDISMTAKGFEFFAEASLTAGQDLKIVSEETFDVPVALVSAGAMQITSTAGDFNFDSGNLSAGTLLQLDAAGDINISSDISQNGAMDFLAGGNIALANSNIITMSDVILNADSVIFSTATEEGNITVGGNLEVTAANSISSLVGSITTTNGNISFTSGDTLSLSSILVTSSGDFSVDVTSAFDYGPTASIDTRGGQFNVNVGNLVANPFMLGPSDTTPFNPVFNSGSGDMVIQSSALGAISLPNILGNNLTATSAGDLTFASSNIDVTGNVALTSTDGDIRYENTPGDYSIAADGDILLSAKTGNVILQESDLNIFVTVDAGNDLTIESGRSVFLDSDFTANGVTRISSEFGDVNYYTGVLNPQGGLIVNGIDINFDLDVITNNADFVANATNGITLNGGVTLGGGNLSLTAASHLASNGKIDVGGGDVTLTSTTSGVATGDIINANRVELSASSGTVNLTSIAANDLIINYLASLSQNSAGALVITGDTQFVARGGSNSFAFLSGANQLNTLSIDIQQSGASPLSLTEIDGFSLGDSIISNLLILDTPSLILDGDINSASGTSNASISFDNANSIGKTLTITPNAKLQNLSVVLGDGDDIINISAGAPVLIDAGLGNDTFNINTTNVLSSLDGGGGSNVLNLLNNSAAIWNITGIDSGRISQGSSDISFINIATLNSGSGADTFNFTDGGSISGLLSGGAGNDTLSMTGTTTDRIWLLNRSGNGDEITDSNSISLLKFNTIESLIGGTGSDSFRAYNVSDVQSINGGSAGNDSLNMTVTDPTSIFSVNPTGVIFNLRNSTASLFFSDSTQNILNFSNIGTFLSGSFSSSDFYGSHVISDDQNYNWKISTSNTGLFDLNILELIDSAGETRIFRGITTFEAGSGTDTFDTTAIARDFSWSINTNNSVLVNGGADQYLIDSLTLSGFENFKTGDGINTFDIASGVAIGNIETGSGNDIFTFGEGVSAQSLLTGAGDDSVTFGDNVTIAGALDGGAGNDTLDISAFTSAIEFNFITGTSSTGLLNQNFETEILPATGSTLFGGDFKTDWLLLDDDTITVTAYNADGSINKTNNFKQSFETLKGGSGENSFQLPSTKNFDGEIQGDASGSNTLTGGDLINNWIIDGQNSGSVQEQGSAITTIFSNIETIIGGANTDTLTGYSSAAGLGWSVDKNLGGSITDGSKTYSFANFENLVGSNGDDTFNIAAQINKISGGGGVNSLEAGIVEDLTWQLNTSDGSLKSTTLNINFDGIQKVYADTLTAKSTFYLNDLASVVKDISAADSTNAIVCFCGMSEPVILDLNDATRQFTGIDSFEGNDAGSQLIGKNIDSQWTVNPADGSLRLVDGSSTIKFIDFETFKAGTGVDTLTATGSSTNSWTISGTNAGDINGTFIFSGIENLSGGAGADTFTFSDNASIGDVLGNDGDDTFVLANNITFTKIDGGVGSGIDTLNTGGRDSIVDYLGNTSISALLVNPINIENVVTGTGGITFSGGDGANTWLINADGSGTLTKTDMDPGTYTFSNVSSVLGGKDTDNFILASGGSLKNGIVGGGANDTLTTQNSGDNIWTIDGTDSGKVTTADGTTLFSQIATLVGGSGNDSFELVTGGSLTGIIDGGTGDDSLRSTDTIRNSWFIAQDSGLDRFSSTDIDLAVFKNIKTIAGTADTFNIGSSATDIINIDGGIYPDVESALISGSTPLVVNLESASLNYYLADDSISRSINISNINLFRVDPNNSAQESQFIAKNETNSWAFVNDPSDNAPIFVSVTTPNGVIRVAGFDIHRGGTGIDTFTGHQDTSGVTWSIDVDNGGSITYGDKLFNFTNFEELIGGDGDDTFNISAQINSISGGAGINQIVSGLSADQTWQLNTSGGTLTASGINVAFDGIQQVYALGILNPVDLIDNNVTFFLNDLNSEVVSVGADAEARSTLSYANLSQPLTLDLNNIGRQVIGIDTFVGNTGSQLIGANVDSLWLADSTDGSLVTVTAGRGVNFTNFASFTGGTGVDSIMSASGDSTWNISGTNSGTLNGSFDFSGIENISGGDGTDTFTFADNASIGDVLGNDGDDTFVMANNVTVNLLDGGLGNDTLDIGNLNSIMDYLGAITVGQVNLPTTSIEQTLSGTGTGSLTLYGGDTDSTWLLGADGSVTITKAGVDYVFDSSSNVSAVLGGLGNDDFTLVQGANLSGGIDGGSSANDSLTMQGTSDVQWTLDKQDGGSFTSNGVTMSFTEIATLVGGDGNDSFELVLNGSNTGSIDGGLGANDTLTNNLNRLVDDTGNVNGWRLAESDNSNHIRTGVTNIATFTGIETIVGQTEYDRFYFGGGTTDVKNIVGRQDSFGLNKANIESSAASIIDLTSDEFSYVKTDSSVSEKITFSNIASFTSNTLGVTPAGEEIGTIIAADVTNTLEVGNGVARLLFNNQQILFSGFDVFQGGNAQDTLVDVSGGVNPLWNVDSNNNGTLSDSTRSYSFTNFENLIGSDSDDTFNVNSSGIQNIDGGAGNNTLIGGNQVNNWDVTEDFGGLFNATNFVNIQNLIGGSAKDTFYVYQDMNIGNIQAGAGDDFVTLDLNASAQNILMEDGDDTVTLLEASSIGGVVDGGIGQDTLDMGAFGSAIELDFLTGLTSSGLEGLNFEFTTQPSEGSAIFGGDLKTDWKFLNGGSFEITAYNADGSVAKTGTFNSTFSLLRSGSGDNNFDLASAENYETTIRANASANNTLSGSDLINDWIISGVNSGSIQEKGGSVATVFENIGHIISSDTANNTFTFMAGGSVKQLDGGGEGTKNHLVIEQNVAANWTIGTGNDQVSLGNATVSFSNIQSIEGSLGADTINIGGAASSVITIDARGGSDTFDISGFTTPGIVNLQTQTAAGMAIAGFEFFTAAGTGNQIIGLDAQASWSLSSANAGVINYQNGTSQISYTGFDSVVGGADIDQFMLAGTTVPTSIDGGAGSDSLTTGNTDNTWLLDSLGGKLNGKRFESIETINAGSGQDSFSLASATVATSAINAGLGENTLTGFNQANDWQIGNSGNGTLNTQLSFSGIQHFVGGSGADDFTVQANTTLKNIYAGAGNDTLKIGADSTVTDLYGEAGDDTFIISPKLTLLGVMDGGTGGEVVGDTIDLSQYQANPGNIEIETLVGFAFANFKTVIQPPNDGSYFGGNGTNIWYISGEDEGRLEVIDGSNIGSYNFSGIHTLLGGTGSDTFIFETDTAAITQKIEGGAGSANNTLDLSAQALVNQWLIDGQNSGKVTNSANPTGNIFANIANIIGGSNIDTLKSDTTGDSTWRIAGVDQGVLEIGANSANFKGIENLQGGQGRDQFILGSIGRISGTIDGSEGVDRLSHTGTSDQWLLNTSDNAVTGTLLDGASDTRMSFVRVEQISGDGSNDQLIATNQDNNTWNVGDSAANAYLNLNNNTSTQIAFEGMEQLVGGSANDVFTVLNANALPTSIDGGLGSDTVNLQAVAQNLDIALGATNAGQINVLQLTNVNVLNANVNQIQQILGASDQGYTWTIDSQNSGTVTTSVADANHQDLRFSDVKAVIGGDHDDIFQVTATTSISLDGSAARTADFVDYSQVNANISINLANSLNGGSGLITGIEGIRGNNSGADSLNTAELIGSNTNNVWTISDFDGAGIADGVNDGQFSDGNQTISFIDFNVLTGGSAGDTFNQSTGIIEGKINGGAGNDTLNITLSSEASNALNNRGTQFIGGGDNDRLNILGGSDALKAAYTATANGGKFDYREIGSEYVVSHSEVELINDQTRARTFEIIGSNDADNLALAESSFTFNQLASVNYGNKDNVIIRSSVNDTVELVENISLAGSLTLVGGNLVTYDSSNTSITAKELILDGTQNVGASTSRIRTSIDSIVLSDTQGDIYLQEQNGLNIAAFNTNSDFDVSLVRGDLTSTNALESERRFTATAQDGNITLNQHNRLAGDVVLNASDTVTLNNDITIKIAGVNADTLLLQSGNNIQQSGPITVSDYTYLDAANDIILDNAKNDFNRISISAGGDATVVDQNTLQLFGVDVDGHLRIRAEGLNIDNSVTANTLELDGGTGSVVMTKESSVNAVGNISVTAEQNIVVSVITGNNQVNLGSSKGEIIDGNGDGENISAKELIVNVSQGVGKTDAIETTVAKINVNTTEGDVGINNTGSAEVDSLKTSNGNIDFNSTGNVSLAGGAVKASGENMGNVSIGSASGDVKQTGDKTLPAIESNDIVIVAPKGDFGAGGFKIVAPTIRVKAEKQVGELITPPGTTRDAQFSGTFKFEDQLLVIEHFEDISPAIFNNVKGYLYNDISLKLSADQLDDDEDDEE